MQSKLKELKISENTIPDAFRAAPKVISPGVHRWLDIIVAVYFGALGIVCARKGKTGAAPSAFINAAMVAGVTAFTDYEGRGEKPINFKLHGTLDAVQASTAVLGPLLHGFSGEPESKWFYGQALNEAGVIAMTDWGGGMPARARRKRAA